MDILDYCYNQLHIIDFIFGYVIRCKVIFIQSILFGLSIVIILLKIITQKSMKLYILLARK